MDERTQALLRDPSVPFQDKAHLFERLDDTRAAYAVMVEGLEGEVLAVQAAAAANFESRGEGYLERLAAAERELKMWKQAGEIAQGSIVVLVKDKPAARMRRADGGGVVPIGTKGWVSWTGRRTDRHGREGRRAALVRLGEDRKTGFYALVENLEAENPWAAVKLLIQEQEELEVCCPCSGDQIRDLRTGRTGEVFWISKKEGTQRRRLGYIPDEPRDTDPVSRFGRTLGERIVWAFAAEVEVQTSWDQVAQESS